MGTHTVTSVAPESEGELTFDVDCGLLFQLGEGAVNKRSVALAELIKNSYDADARHVVVEFKDVATVDGGITVRDDGTGISFLHVRESWMRIATTEKEQIPISPVYGRHLAGAKGIGRFATRRLARQLELTSVAYVNTERRTGPKEETKVFFDWEKFTPGKDVQTVPVTYEHRYVNSETPTGVTLRLKKVRDAWSEEDLRDLYRDLIRLITPLPRGMNGSDKARRDPGFNVEFQAREFPKQSGSLAREFLRTATATLEGKLMKTGQAKYVLRFRKGRRKSKTVYRFSPADRHFSRAAPASFKIYYFVYKSDQFAGLSINVREAQSVGQEEGGVHIFVDRFRVPPYGDPGDDWLGLDEARAKRVMLPLTKELRSLSKGAFRPVLLVPSNNQLFGQIFLSRSTNPELRQTLNRERLQENEAFQDLRDFVRVGLSWLTVMYARHTEEERAREREARRAETFSPRALLDRAREQIAALPSDVSPEHRQEALQAIELASRTIEEEEEEKIGELQMLRVLASTGTMIVVFDHQLLGILQGLRESHENLGAFVPKLPKQDQIRFERILEDLCGWIEDAEHQAKLLGLLLGSEARKRKHRIAVRPVVEAFRKAFAKYSRDLGIEIRNDVPPTIRTPPMFECELSAILVNLFTNALKAVKLRRPRKIKVGAGRRDGSIEFHVMDTGTGANPKRWVDFFKPFVSESTPDPVLGAGTGLGLKIVKDFVNVYGGEARFTKPKRPWRTRIEVRLPVRW